MILSRNKSLHCTLHEKYRYRLIFKQQFKVIISLYFSQVYAQTSKTKLAWDWALTWRMCEKKISVNEGKHIFLPSPPLDSLCSHFFFTISHQGAWIQAKFNER